MPARRPARSDTSRRKFLGAASTAAAGAAIAGFPSIAVAQSPAVLRFQSAWSARDVFHEYALDYARTVREMSGGRVRIEMLSAGAVAKPSDLLDAVHKGALDGCHAAPGLWAHKDLAFSLFGSGPALGLDANQMLSWLEYGGGRALYDELLGRMLNLDVAGFPYGPLPAQPLGWFARQLTSASQLKGLRVLARGTAGELMRELGAVVQDLPDHEIAEAARARKLDGVVPSHAGAARELGLPDVFPVCVLTSLHQPAPVLEVLYSRKRLDALPADLRSIVHRAARAASADVSWKATQRAAAEHAELRARYGARLVPAPADVLRAQLKAWDALARRASRDNPYYDRVFHSQQAWARRVLPWTLDTRVDSRIAQEYWSARPGPDREPLEPLPLPRKAG